MNSPAAPDELFADQARNSNGNPVFAQPWQAQAFAMTLALHQRGFFNWTEWAAALAQQIKLAQTGGDADAGDTYYHHWLGALECLLAAKGLVSTGELISCAHAWEQAAERTPHGQPIVLAGADFEK